LIPHFLRFFAHDFISCTFFEPRPWRQTGQKRP
jgi:hypothetical protein